MRVRAKASSTTGSPQLPPDKPRGSTDDVSAGENHFWEPLALAAAAATDPIAGLENILPILASSYSADRAWIGRYNPGLTHFWGVSDWVGPGIVSHLQEMQGVSVDVIAAAHHTFLRRELVVIPDIERLPRQSRSLQAELRREGIRSTLAGPVVHDEKLIGFFGFDHVRALAAWTPADLERLPVLGKFLGALLHRSLKNDDVPADPATASRSSIHVTEANGRRVLSLDEVVFIEADGDYSKVHVGDGRQYLERRSLRAWISQLPRDRFLRVHQSYLVNGLRIARLDRGPKWALELQGIPNAIPVGRAFRHAVRLHLGF